MHIRAITVIPDGLYLLHGGYVAVGADVTQAADAGLIQVAAQLLHTGPQVNAYRGRIVAAGERRKLHNRHAHFHFCDKGIGLAFIIADDTVRQTGFQNACIVLRLFRIGIFQQHGQKAPLLTLLLQQLEHLGEVGVVHFGQGNGNDVGAARPKALGQGVGAIVQRLDGLSNPGPGLLPHVLGSLEIFGHGGNTDTGLFRNVFDRGQENTFLS